jgi:hypothetical protein
MNLRRLCGLAVGMALLAPGMAWSSEKLGDVSKDAPELVRTIPPSEGGSRIRIRPAVGAWFFHIDAGVRQFGTGLGFALDGSYFVTDSLLLGLSVSRATKSLDATSTTTGGITSTSNAQTFLSMPLHVTATYLVEVEHPWFMGLSAGVGPSLSYKILNKNSSGETTSFSTAKPLSAYVSLLNELRISPKVALQLEVGYRHLKVTDFESFSVNTSTGEETSRGKLTFNLNSSSGFLVLGTAIAL